MRMAKGTANVEMVTEECCNCGILFAMTQELMDRRRRDHDWFYCPNGHGQKYTGKNEAERLRKTLKDVKTSRDEAIACCTDLQEVVVKERQRTAGHKGHARKLQKQLSAEGGPDNG